MLLTLIKTSFQPFSRLSSLLSHFNSFIMDNNVHSSVKVAATLLRPPFHLMLSCSMGQLGEKYK